LIAGIIFALLAISFEINTIIFTTKNEINNNIGAYIMRNQYIMNRMKTVSFIFGNGCQRSFVEACWVVKFLIVNGWEITPRIDKASLVFFYGCGFTSNAEQRSIKQLKLANRLKRKESPIIACGCLPGINKNLVSNGLCTHGIARGYIDKIDEIVASDISIKMVKEPNDLTRYQFIRKWPQHSEVDFF
jgi:tRNA A37 methylthiotransferase MiaB